MNNLETRKAQLREYIEAKPLDKSLVNMSGSPEATDRVIKACLSHRLIAEQLLECIEALEKYKNSRSFIYCDPKNIYREVYLAEEVLEKIAGEK